jgi:hypothetical protein
MPGLLPAEVQPRSIFSYNRPAEPVIESHLDCIDFVTKANDIAFEVYGADVAEVRWSKSLLFQNVNLAKLFLNLFDVFGATGMSGQILLARYRHPAASSRYDRYCNLPAVLKGLKFFRKSPN